MVVLVVPSAEVFDFILVPLFMRRLLRMVPRSLPMVPPLFIEPLPMVPVVVPLFMVPVLVPLFIVPVLGVCDIVPDVVVPEVVVPGVV